MNLRLDVSTKQYTYIKLLNKLTILIVVRALYDHMANLVCLLLVVLALCSLQDDCSQCTCEHNGKQKIELTNVAT